MGGIGLYGKMSVSNSDMYKRRRGGEGPGCMERCLCLTLICINGGEGGGEGLYGKMSVSNSDMYKCPPRKQNSDYKRN